MLCTNLSHTRTPTNAAFQKANRWDGRTHHEMSRPPAMMESSTHSFLWWCLGRGWGPGGGGRSESAAHRPTRSGILFHSNTTWVLTRRRWPWPGRSRPPRARSGRPGCRGAKGGGGGGDWVVGNAPPFSTFGCCMHSNPYLQVLSRQRLCVHAAHDAVHEGLAPGPAGAAAPEALGAGHRAVAFDLFERGGEVVWGGQAKRGDESAAGPEAFEPPPGPFGQYPISGRVAHAHAPARRSRAGRQWWGEGPGGGPHTSCSPRP